jgi:hypothetical protein
MRVRADSLHNSTLIALLVLVGSGCAAPRAEVEAPSEAAWSDTSDFEHAAAPSASSDEEFEPASSESSDADAEAAPSDADALEPLPGETEVQEPPPPAVPGVAPPPRLSSPLSDPDNLPVLWSERVGNALGASGALSLWVANCGGFHPPGCTGGFVSGELGVFGVAAELGVGFTMPSGFRYLGISALGMTLAPSVLHQWRNWPDDLEAARTLYGGTLGFTYIVNIRGGLYANDGSMVVTGSIGVGN